MKWSLLFFLVALLGRSVTHFGAESGLIGHWKLQGDCRDSSGNGLHGVNHGVNLERGEFDGISAFIEIPQKNSPKLGSQNFSLCAWIRTERDLDDVVGDIASMYDPAIRKGFNLNINSTGSGYSGPGNDRQVSFGIDNAQMSDWEDCGRPSPTSRYISNSMLAYKGKLYAAITDARDEDQWCHVFRYEGNQNWSDCGRVGRARTTGVGPLVVHNGELYAVTSTYDWTRISTGGYDPGRVYRYSGGTNWVDCGQPGPNRTLNSAASFKGELFVGGGPEEWAIYVREAGDQWTPSSIFAKDGPQRCFPHPMGRYNGKLFTAWPGVHSFDGTKWTFAGFPAPLDSNPTLQTHAFAVYAGRLCAGTWPEARVSSYLGGENWQDMGRVGADGTEVNALTVYNGKLYGGSIPRAEVCRYDGESRWTSLKRFYSPEGWQPGLPGRAERKQVNQWGRVTSLAIHKGRLFAGLGNCTSSVTDNPPDGDIFGKVFSMEGGKSVSFDEDLSPGWKHLAAIREGNKLKLYVEGELVAESTPFNAAEYDISVDRPLLIGFGQTDYFAGRISDVRLYSKALTAADVQSVYRKSRQ